MFFGVIMEDREIRAVTSTAKCAMTLFIIGLFIAGTVFFWGMPFAMGNDAAIARLLCDICGSFYLVLTIQRIMEYRNRRITVSADGVEFINSFGKKMRYSWDNVQIDSYSTRGFKIVFMINKKRIVIHGYYKNMGEMCALLADLGKY